MMDFDRFYGHLLRGELPEAMTMLKSDPDQSDLCQQYHARFIQCESEPPLEGIPGKVLCAYQKYYRAVFYLRHDRQQAADILAQDLCRCLGASSEGLTLDALEEGPVATAFSSAGYHFLGGKTGGFYGPYVWESTEEVCYTVELPEGEQCYTVKLLDGFVSRSWLDYLSLGRIGTGGWTDGDGIINCVRSAYDLDSESFTVSLLKHEAQHVMDLRRWPEMTPEDLEYRAKLVELVYTNSRNLLLPFLQEAGSNDHTNGHSLAAERIVAGFKEKLGISAEALKAIPLSTIQPVALDRVRESTPPLSVRDTL